MNRAQLPLSLIELSLGVVLILGVTAGFALGTPQPDRQTPQLEAYAEDTATILGTEPPRHSGATRLVEVVASERAFERERGAVERRVERILPPNLLFRISTPHGAVGFPTQMGVPVGRATVPTGYGRVQVEVWYA